MTKHLYVHAVDPHYSHDFADLYFEGKRYCVTESMKKPVSPLEVIQFFETQTEANKVALAR